jgi:hypothetical protein
MSFSRVVDPETVPFFGKENLMLIETFEDAVKWRRIHRNKLKLGKKPQRRVARKLRKCRPGQRCGIEACRVCMREFRISWLGEAIKIIAQSPHWTRCSIITKGLLVPYGQVIQFDLKQTVKRIRKRLERSDLRSRIVLGALDVSLNVANNVIAGWHMIALRASLSFDANCAIY